MKTVTLVLTDKEFDRLCKPRIRGKEGEYHYVLTPDGLYMESIRLRLGLPARPMGFLKWWKETNEQHRIAWQRAMELATGIARGDVKADWKQPDSVTKAQFAEAMTKIAEHTHATR